jgi:NADPH:quinone reductase-like Zn-dependent oxidoreductase
MNADSPSTMKASVLEEYGSPDVLELREMATPQIADDEVLVRVQAASINPLDWHLMRGRPLLVRATSGWRKPKQSIGGVDVAGTIEAVGPGATALGPGDEVFGFGEGSFAEFAKAKATTLTARPTNITPSAAASVPIAGVTALQGLRDLGRIEAGHRVLIIGASGGVGTFAVQLARTFGAEVTGVCSARNVDLVRSIGADHVIDYTTESIAGKYDLIFQLAGTASPGRLRRHLTRRGTLVLSSGMGRFSGVDRIARALATSPFVSQRLVTWVTKSSGSDLEVLAGHLAAGTVVPVIDRTYPLSEVADAIRYVEEGHARGKVVVTVED